MSRGGTIFGLLFTLGAATYAAGCAVDPYCVTCGTSGVRDGAVRDGNVDGMMDGFVPDDAAGVDGAVSDGAVDAPRGDGCLPEEVCNGFDDDCDGVVDNGFDLTRDPFHCGFCDNVCALPHAFPVCTGGVCTIGSCDVGFYDLNADAADGCEYPCSGTASNDVTCDLRDDDCDGMIDEDVNLTSDLVNCGSCGNVCRFGHATAVCAASVCEIAACSAGYWDVDASPTNGCEYFCTAATPPLEVCNLRDDDCNGLVDDGDPGGGGSCGTDVGVCSMGVQHCVRGALACEGEVLPIAELCNGLDDDCDGVIDNGNPGGGAFCGSGVGACRRGTEQCTGGLFVCTGGVSPTVELCDGLDNDCDGIVDNGNPEGGASCGSGVGACAAGIITCTGAALVCAGGTGPTPELCNGLDDDCDGAIDNGNPGGGGACGTDVGLCRPGVNDCTGGALVCVGQVGPVAEICNSLDDDCDGVIDNGNPGGGAPCGSSVGACIPGAVSCRGGTLACVGAIGPRLELCNGVDDDCDGLIDQTFDLTSDVNNCGSCGNVCAFAHGVAACVSSACSLVMCNMGWANADGLAANGCELSCTFRGAELCNGVDDDCNGVIDDGIVPPASFCNVNGVCVGTSATCGGTSGWQCAYSSPNYQAIETRCDGLDNDCDGSVDEPYPLVGAGCTNGEQGACLRTGTYICNLAGSGLTCTAPTSGGGTVETCNGLDDNCDGLVDNGMSPAALPTVAVPRVGGGTVNVMRYEASRPDATAVSEGTNVTHACGNAAVIPWTGVTWTEAQNACCALNAGGACLGGGAGWRLCDAPDWQTACQGPATTCAWSYATSCATSQPTTCNGHEYDCDLATAGVQNCLATTGAATFAQCRTDWGALGSVYDLSGNVKEWTATLVGSSIYEIRGGAYTNIEAGRQCIFDFTVGQQAFAFGNTGFRCCQY